MLWIEPAARTAPLVQFIAQARGTLDINTYLATDRRILRAITTAVGRGVHVRVLVDRRPYGGRPRGEVAHLKTTGAQVRYAPPRFTGRYRFDHAKYMVSGTRVEIGSANLTWSAFYKNREYLWIAYRPAVATALKTVFDADWLRKRAGSGPRQTLVLSPGATGALTHVIKQPGSVCIESEELGNDRAILAALRSRGASVHLLLPSQLSPYDRGIATQLKTSGVRIRFLTHPYLHAKLIAGQNEAFLGSENFSYASLNKNREVGIILGDPGAEQLYAQCGRDWQVAR